MDHHKKTSLELKRCKLVFHHQLLCFQPGLFSWFTVFRFTVFQSFQQSRISIRLPVSNQNHLRCDIGPVFAYQGTLRNLGREDLIWRSDFIVIYRMGKKSISSTREIMLVHFYCANNEKEYWAQGFFIMFLFYHVCFKPKFVHLPQIRDYSQPV